MKRLAGVTADVGASSGRSRTTFSPSTNHRLGTAGSGVVSRRLPPPQSTMRSMEQRRIADLELELKTLGKKYEVEQAEMARLRRVAREGQECEKLRLSRLEQTQHSTAEELQATLDELADLRDSLRNAQSHVATLTARNAELAEMNATLRRLVAEKKTSSSSLTSSEPAMEDGRSVRGAESGTIGATLLEDEIEIIRQELERERANSAAQSSELEQARRARRAVEGELERAHSHMQGEDERVDVQEQQRQWEQFQRDLLLAVRVAENFQAESQIEVKQLQQQLHALNKRDDSTTLASTSNCAEGDAYRPSAMPPRTDSTPRDEDAAMWAELLRGGERGSRRNALLAWCQRRIVTVAPHLEVTNFSSCWTDGSAVCALLASFLPDEPLLDLRDPATPSTLLARAMTVSQRVGIPALLRVDQMENAVEWRTVYAYVLSLYKHFRSHGNLLSTLESSSIPT